jgi:hypothetical protein
MDYAADENFKRQQDEPFNPFFYRHGVPERGAFRVDDEYFIEQPAAPAGAAVEFEWDGERYTVDVPALDADVTFVEIRDGVREPPVALHVVLVRPASWRDAVRSWFAQRRPSVIEVDSSAVRADSSAGSDS